MSYIYHAMYARRRARQRARVASRSTALKESLEERGHAELLMNYQIMRGGRVELQAIMPPQVDYDHPEKGDALYAFELSLSLEKLNNDRLIALHRVAGEADDANMQDFIGAVLEDQVKSIEEVSRRPSGSSRARGNKRRRRRTSTSHGRAAGGGAMRVEKTRTRATKEHTRPASAPAIARARAEG